MSPNANIPDTKVPDTQEFFENQSQMNTLNSKRTFDEFQDLALTSARRSQSLHDQLTQQAVDLQAKVNQAFFDGRNRTDIELAQINAMRARHADLWAYEQAYDLGNPVTTGAGDALRSAAYTPNRAVDTATAGVAATVPASSDLRIIETVQALATQLLAFAQQLQNARQSTPAAS